LRRRVWQPRGEPLAHSRPDDTAAAIDQAESLVFSVAERRIVDSTQSLHDLLDESLDRLEELYERGDAFSGLATGFSSLDRILAGIQPSSLVVVGARPAMGKTSLALTMASSVAAWSGNRNHCPGAGDFPPGRK